MEDSLCAIGAVSAAVAVLIGGARAHFLPKKLPAERLPLLEVGMRYQLAHSIAIVLASFAASRFAGALPVLAGWGFLLGLLLFCGGAYGYALSGRRGLMKAMPAGGLMLVLSWLTLALSPLLGS